ncbi:MAG TPA: PEP-CTERM sorting domain-containing protein [Candidatus Saccharimonadales bacterium]|nr:PEP-CTERM sorting domain-containing protein [Candidatus Saccharimonadales bacterium]
MKIENLIARLSAGLLVVMSVRAQGTFQNLDFEQANPIIILGSQYYPYEVTEASALSYWTVTYGTVQQTQITYNDPSTGSTWVVLVAPGSMGVPPGSSYRLAAIDGRYSVLLQGGITAPAASISQTGLIPISTKSLFFDAEAGSGPFAVSVGGRNIPFEAVGTGVSYTLYGADISAWAGDTEPLTFSALEGGGLNNWLIDDISFSTAAVPEPSSILLTGVGGLMLAFYRRYK